MSRSRVRCPTRCARVSSRVAIVACNPWIVDADGRREKRDTYRALFSTLGRVGRPVLWGAVWVWGQYIYLFGFPDGYKSELGTAEDAMAIWFCSIIGYVRPGWR